MTFNKMPPYRAEHVGSFIRPNELLNAARSFKKGEITKEKFDAIKNKSISDIVSFQDSIGMPSITDGEFRRRVWSGGVSDALTGMSIKDSGTLTFKSAEGDVLMPPFTITVSLGNSSFSRCAMSYRKGGISRFSLGLKPFNHAFRA